MEKALVNHGKNGWAGKLRHDGGTAGPRPPQQGRKQYKRRLQAVRATAPATLAAQAGVCPNPATTTAFVALPAALGRVAVAAERVDALGRTVCTPSLPAQDAAAYRLDRAHLPTGRYPLHLATAAGIAAGIAVKKLVVE